MKGRLIDFSVKIGIGVSIDKSSFKTITGINIENIQQFPNL